jgi:hypothetical protein
MTGFRTFRNHNLAFRLQIILYKDCDKMPIANQRFCRAFFRILFHKKQTKTTICKGLGFCQSKIEDNEDLNAIDMEYVGDNTPDAQTCDTCVKMVEVMKGDQLEVSSQKESEEYKL